VSKIARRGLIGVSAVLFLAVGILPAMDAGQAQQHPARPHASNRLAKAADTTFQTGFHATLPPHISTLLGISKEESTPVMQSVVRSGSTVQGLDVVSVDKNEIVLFVVDEASNDQNLYLTSPDGMLRKVVSIKAGVGSAVRISDKDRKAFEMEKQFWMDRLAPLGKTK
jgi:hypothetical protein